MSAPRIVKPSFRAPAYKMPVHPPVFPVMMWAKGHDGLRTDALPASATFVSERGLFFTARHVVELAPDPTALRVLFHDDKRFIPQPFVWQLHPELDVAACVAPVPEGFLAKRLVIGVDELACDEEVWTVGYGEYAAVEHEGATADTKGLTLNFWPALRVGKVLDIAREGAPMTPGPAYIHSAFTPGGNSGGPLMRAATQTVHGICSSGASPDDVADTYGVATDVRAVLDWRLSAFGGETLRDLAVRGLVSIRAVAQDGSS